MIQLACIVQGLSLPVINKYRMINKDYELLEIVVVTQYTINGHAGNIYKFFVGSILLIYTRLLALNDWPDFGRMDESSYYAWIVLVNAFLLSHIYGQF
jgi:hypothetical protein